MVVLSVLVLVAVLVLSGVCALIGCLFLALRSPEPVPPDIRLEGVAIQRAEALALAEPHLAEHGTYE